MRAPWIAGMLWLGACLLLPEPARAHGGRWLGSRDVVPVPMRDGLRGGCHELVVSLDSWEFWWGFHRDRYVSLDSNRSQACGIEREKISAALVAILDQSIGDERGRGETWAALIALAKLGVDSRRPIQCISRFLSSSDTTIQETAAIALGILGDPHSVGMLEGILDNPEAPLRTRAFAAYGLGLIGHAASGNDSLQIGQRHRIAGCLLRNLAHDRSEPHDIEIACITALGLLAYDNTDRATLVHGVVLPTLERIVHDDSQKGLIRAHVPTTIARILRRLEEVSSRAEMRPVRDSYVDRFLDLLADRPVPAHFVRQSVVLALGTLVADGDPGAGRVVQRLMELRENAPSQQERHLTAIALGRIRGGSAMAFLGNQVSRGKVLYRPWAALGLAIAGLGRSGTEALPPHVAEQIVSALQREKAPEFKGGFVIALGLLGHRPAQDLLRQEMRMTRVASYRGHCAVALALMGEKGALEDIRAEIGESADEPEELVHLIPAVGLLGGGDSVDLLLAMLRDGRHARPVYPALASALGFAGDRRAVDPLLRMTTDMSLTGETRAFAIVALGMLGDDERMPWCSAIFEDLNYRAAVSTLTGGASGILDIL